MDELRNKVKLSLRISSDAYDDEIDDVIMAALLDLGIAGVNNYDVSNKLIVRAVTTYVRMHFGKPNDYGDFDRLKASYDEQKAQMSTSSLYKAEV